MSEITQSDNVHEEIGIGPLHYGISAKCFLLLIGIEDGIETLGSAVGCGQFVVEGSGLLWGVGHAEFDLEVEVDPAVEEVEDE